MLGSEMGCDIVLACLRLIVESVYALVACRIALYATVFQSLKSKESR